jgi:hypothetical protein
MSAGTMAFSGEALAAGADSLAVALVLLGAGSVQAMTTAANSAAPTIE